MKIKLSLMAFAIFSVFSAAAQPLPEALRDAARKAVVSNPEVQARWHAFLASKEEQDSVRGGFFPKVDLSASIGLERQDRPGTTTGTYTHTNATLTLNQMLFDGFFTKSEVNRLGYAKLVRYYELVDASENIALEAVRAYIDVVRARELVELAKVNYVEHRQTQEQLGKRAEAGVSRRVDLEQATGRLALAESNLLTEMNNLHDVSSRYLRIVGETPPASTPSPSDNLSSTPLPATVNDALVRAFAANPALHAAVENVRAGEALVNTRKAPYYPRLDFKVLQSVDRNLDGVRGRSSDSIVQLVLNYNLYRGGADNARLFQAIENLNQAKDLREKACRDLRQTLSIAFNDVQRLKDQLEFLNQHALSTEKAREAYRQQFDIGQRTLLDLLDTQNEYYEAARAYVNARFNRITAQARTLNGMGRLMAAIEVSRPDLPASKDVGQDREGIDPAEMCGPLAPVVVPFDSAKAMSDAPPRISPPPAAAPRR
jgi:adhesin transport system outer membrane protein